MKTIGYKITLADLYRLLSEIRVDEDIIATLCRENEWLEIPADLLVKVEERKGQAEYARSTWWNYRA